MPCGNDSVTQHPSIAVIAVVDDDPTMLDLLATLLSEAGYITNCWPSGLLAFERLVNDPPDLVILDLQLDDDPEAGWHILSDLRVEPRTAHIPVLVMSAHREYLNRRQYILRTRKRALTLAKPFDVDMLLERIQDALLLAPGALDGQ